MQLQQYEPQPAAHASGNMMTKLAQSYRKLLSGITTLRQQDSSPFASRPPFFSKSLAAAVQRLNLHIPTKDRLLLRLL